MLFSRRDHPKLLQHSQVILIAPLIHDLAPSDASHEDPRHRHLLAGRGDAKERSSCVPGANRIAGRDLVLLGDHIFNREVSIRQGGEDHGYGLLETCKAGGLSGRGRVVGDVVGVQLIDDGQLPRVDNLLKETTDEGLVFLC